jgi:mono/diheme cytochrome c family protein
MPSEDYNRLTDPDFGALIAYVRSLRPAAGEPAEVRLPLAARVLYGFGAIRDAAAKIDHARAPEEAVPEGVTPAHGAYVANTCVGCHGQQLLGGRIPGSPPDWPPAPRLASGEGSAMASYPDADSLIRLFRTGRRADGSAVRVMPFDSLRETNETDLRALHLYLSGRQDLAAGPNRPPGSAAAASAPPAASVGRAAPGS